MGRDELVGQEDARVGKAIAEFRERARLSQTALAEGVGVGQQLISRLETGKSRVGVTILLKIADFLRISPRELLDEAGIDLGGRPEGDEGALLRDWRTLSGRDKRLASEILRLMAPRVED